jgi:uncharacterized protein YqjF (DUF2071 family)
MHPSFAYLDHRPWPLPQPPWRWRQTWTDLAFLHWEIAETALRNIIPDELEIDTFDGSAWIGLVPFDMKGVMLRGMPDLPGVSHFPEINVRTYVIHDGKPGVWFFSLDAPNHLAVWAAQRFFHLPYNHAQVSLKVSENKTHYRAIKGSREFEAVYTCKEPLQVSEGSFEHWATERYCLYAQGSRGQLYRGDVHHQPWPLQRATIDIHTNSYLADFSLGNMHPQILYSKSIPVAVWALAKIS